jgi:hypothetical protein
VVSRKGQSLMEYTVLFVCITAAVIGMQIYVKRAIQGRIKQTADQVGEPYDTNNFRSTVYSNMSSNMTNRQFMANTGMVDAYGQPIDEYGSSVAQDANSTREQSDVFDGH